MIFFVVHTGDIDNILEEKVEKDTNIDSVAFKDMERWSVTHRLLSWVVHNAADMLWGEKPHLWRTLL